MSAIPVGQAVYVIDGARTPFLKVGKERGSFSAADLAVSVGRLLLQRQPFLPTDLDEVILGCAMPAPEEANIARIVALRLGCGQAVPAWTVQRNCASGMQAIDSAIRNISCGRAKLILAGGTEAMSHSPLLFSEAFTDWISAVRSARGFKKTLQQILHFRPTYLKPTLALLRGLRDPIVNLSMGQTAENIVYRFNISREEMDRFAFTSHQRATSAEPIVSSEILPLFSVSGQSMLKDSGIRPGTSLEQLSRLQPVFDKPFGTITAGNSSQVTDGAALLLLASRDAVEHYQLPTLARLVETVWVGLDPAEMGLGPVYAIHQLLKQQQLSLEDIDYWEINEAFAAQVLACLIAGNSHDFCKQFLGLSQPLGKIALDRLNVDGGAIALGHPIGATGARLVLHLIHVLQRTNTQKGIASLCIGGGQGGAMLIENTV